MRQLNVAAGIVISCSNNNSTNKWIGLIPVVKNVPSTSERFYDY